MPVIAAERALQRVGFLVTLPPLLKKFGVEPDAVLASAGLPADALNNPENTIPYKAMGLVMEMAAERTGCAHLGLEIGKHIGLSSLGVIGDLMRNAPTVGTALMDFATHQHRNAHGGVVYLIVEELEAIFGYAIYEPGVAGHDLICDGAALAACNLVVELAGKNDGQLLRVMLSRPTPADLEPYRRAFKIQLQFDAAHIAVVMPRRVLNTAVSGASMALRKELEMQVQILMYSGEPDLVTLLSRALRVGLLRQRHSISDVASQMGMSPRTLQRRLQDVGVSFQEALDGARLEFAKQLLANTRLSVGEIAAMVGYADPSNLFRHFAQQVGKAPQEWRLDRDRERPPASS